MTIQLPEKEWRTTGQNHQHNQKNMRTIRRRDPILIAIERTTVTLIMVPESKPCSFTAAKCNFSSLYAIRELMIFILYCPKAAR
jgi:hypothetical protein